MNQFIPPPDSMNEPMLEGENVINAISDLYVTKPYPKINRKFIDPPMQGEPRFALFSYVKAPDVAADKDGFFGVAKIRGVFYTADEADKRAEELIKSVDSVNSIFTCMVGVPFPLVCSGHATETTEVDLQQKTEVAITENAREKRQKEQKEMDEIKERRENLMKDVDPNIDKSEDTYVEQRVKLAHLKFNISEHEIKRKECIELKAKVLAYLIEKSKLNPEYEETYMKRYKEGRRAAHIPEDTDLTGFMKFMADPLE